MQVPVFSRDTSGTTIKPAQLSVNWRSEYGPRIVLYLFCASILAVAAFYRGHSVESMDVRTYAQMIRAISERGLPYWDNGPIERFPELIVQWAVPSRGHVWGIYGPLYPYLAAPVFRLGGLELVSSFTFAMLAPLALVTSLLAKRLVRNEWYATFAGLLVVISTPITAKALEVTPFPLTAILATLGMLLTVNVIESRAPRASTALLCGVAWAAAAATHALCFPMAIAGLGVVGAAPDPRANALVDGDLRARFRSAAEVARGRLVPALVGFIGAMLPVAYLNHLRFNSYNPLSYGPIPWTGNVNEELLKMNLVDQVRYSAVPALFVVVVLVAAFLARKRKLAVLSILATAALVLVLTPTLRERFLRYGIIALGYLVDMSLIDMGPAYVRAPDGLGQIFAGWVVKSTLQCTPLLVLAPLALRGAHAHSSPGSTATQRWPLLAVLVPCAALYLSFITRANLSTNVDAIGWPWVYVRYTFAALPGLLVASLVVVERLGLKPLHFAVTVGVGASVCLAFVESHDDAALVKRVMLLVAPVALAAMAFAAASWAQRGQERSSAACMLVALTLGLGIAIGLGHDLRANILGKRGCDGAIDRVTKVFPHRFALVGMLGQFDVVLTTAATHDVQYADTLRLGDRYADLHPLLEHWQAEGRPIYFLWNGGEPYNPWPDVSFKRVSTGPDLFLAELHGASSASSR